MARTQNWTRDGFEIAHNCTPEDLWIAIPHQRRPYVVSSRVCPPETDGDTPDADFDGDHDLHAHVLVIEAHEWRGHRRHAVHALAEERLEQAAEWS